MSSRPAELYTQATDVQERLYYPDVVRALAITMVVALHIVAAQVLKAATIGMKWWWPANLVDSLTRVSVPLFVMVSGALLLNPARDEPLPVFFRKRFLKVFVPFLGWGVIYIFWRIYFNLETITISQAVHAFLENDIAYHFWFLYMILGLYLATPILRAFMRHARESEVRYFLIAWFAAVTISPLLTHFFKTSVAIDWVVATGYAGYFVAGSYLSRICLTTQMKKAALAVYAAAACMTIFGTYLLLRQTNTFDGYFYDYLTPNVILMSLCTFLLLRDLPYARLFSRFPLLWKIVLLFSTTSFGVYMVHVMALALLKSGKLGFGLAAGSIFPGVGILATLLVVLPASILVVWILQRTPLLRVLVP